MGMHARFLPIRLISTLQRLRAWQIWLGMVVLSLLLSEAIAAAMGWLLLGRVTADYLLTGMVASVLVASPVAALILASGAETRRLAAHLAESEERYRIVSSLGSDFIFSCRRDGGEHLSIDWLAGSCEPLFGLTPDELKARDCWRCAVVAEDLPAFDRHVAALAPGQAGECELRIRHADGSLRQVQVHARALPRAPGADHYRLYGTCRDITERKRTEAELQRLGEAVRQCTEVIVLADTSLHIRYVNPAFERLFGYALDEVRGRHLSLLQPTEAEQRAANAIETGAFLGERLRRTKDGRNIPVLLKVAQIKDADDAVAGLVGTMTDLTDIRKAEQATRDNETKYRLLFETAGDGIFLQDATCFIDCNEKGASLYGLSRAEVIGRSPADLCPERQPDGRLSAEVAGDRIAAALRGEPQRFEWRPLRADGAPLDVEISLNRLELGGAVCLQAVVRDITERKRAESRLRLAASVFDHAHEGICITDAEQRIVDVNATFCELTGYARDEVLGRTPRLLKSGHQAPEFYAAMWQAIAREGHWQGEVWNRRRSGQLYAERLTISAVRDEHGAVSHYVGVLTDITSLKAYQEKLEKIAHYDALTGIPNRVLLADRMRQAIAQTQRSRSLLAICYLDLDGFKPVNDSYGHEAGDGLLVEMAARLRSCLRGGDTVARLGGDEFVLLLLGLDQADECARALQRILESIASPVTVAGQPVCISASIGVALFPQDDAPPDILLRHADQAMYRAKQQGKNRYHVFDPGRDGLAAG